VRTVKLASKGRFSHLMDSGFPSVRCKPQAITIKLLTGSIWPGDHIIMYYHTYSLTTVTSWFTYIR